jgi:hypothetical protein
MSKNNMKTIKPQKIAARPNSEFYGDWFYDELMTSQPEATRDFIRARLLSSTHTPPQRRAPKH